MNLPELSASAHPQFVDAASCKRWLEHVPLANVVVAQQDLLAELEVFNRFPTAVANRLAVMEALREAVSFVQVEQAKRFMNRPLPMAKTEASAFEDTIELWEQMRLGYLRCLDAALAGDAAMRGQAALIAQRVTAYCGLKMLHYYRAYREVPPREWRALHQAYLHAERLGVAEEPVKDFLSRDIQDSSSRIAYARAVLMGMCNPHELSQRQLTFVAYLLERWAAKLEVSREPVDEGEGAPPLIADLGGERCPERADPAPLKAAEPRYLDGRKLAKSLRNRVGLLRKGESPAKLALGEDCVQPSCEQTLVFLFRQWCQAKTARAVQRARSSAIAQVSNDLEAIHHYVSGGTARRAVHGADLTHQQRQELETLGHIRTTDERDASGTRLATIEEWKVEDDSAQGMHLVRAAATAGRRYSHGQLLAVRPSDATSFLLGHVRWLMGAANGDLHAGVRLMPGIPIATTVRSVGLNVSERPVAALRLDAMPALQAPATLVLPAGWFKPKRILEIVGDKPLNVRLNEVIERGLDFERVTYEPA